MNDHLRHILGQPGLFGKIVGVFTYFFTDAPVRPKNGDMDDYGEQWQRDRNVLDATEIMILRFFVRRRKDFFDEEYILEHVEAYDDLDGRSAIYALITRGLLVRTDDEKIGLSETGLANIDTIIRQ